ncbi:MAG: hypothetical protein GWM98_04700 [Nitrospinaceae bacterium]|nr:hypothetical protein [Deltaproteobacteria bacterium]NIY14219.1 hypothetical protein [Nitrospinaceae bacterium]
MTQLFNRDFSLILGPLEIPARAPGINPLEAKPTLRARFNVQKSLASNPNNADLTLYNLNIPHRSALKEGAATGIFPLIIKAGYVNTTQEIFVGTVKMAESSNQGVNWITSIRARDDGNKRWQSARLNKTYAYGTPFLTLLTAAALELGIGLGNSAIQFAKAKPGRLFFFKKGVTVRGRVVDILDKYIAGAGFTWSIQDGQLQILGPAGDDTILGSMVILSKITGLVGTPEYTEEGGVRARSLLNGLITPGRRVLIESASVFGQFRVTQSTFTGDSWGPEWYTDFEGERVTPI